MFDGNKFNDFPENQITKFCILNANLISRESIYHSITDTNVDLKKRTWPDWLGVVRPVQPPGYGRTKTLKVLG